MDNYPIDFVIPWVDGSDKEWRREKNRYAEMEEDRNSEFFKQWCVNESMLRDWGTFKYM